MNKVVLSVAAWSLAVGTLTAQELSQSAPVAAGDHLFDTFSYARLSAGDVSFSLAANAAVPVGARGAGTVYDIYGAIGYFLTDHLEAEGVLRWVDVGPEEGSAIAAGANWYFTEFFDYVYPYVGLGISSWFGGLRDEGTHAAVKGGVRYYVSAHTGFRAWGEYDTSLDNADKSRGTFRVYIGFFTLAR